MIQLLQYHGSVIEVSAWRDADHAGSVSRESSCFVFSSILQRLCLGILAQSRSAWRSSQKKISVAERQRYFLRHIFGGEAQTLLKPRYAENGGSERQKMSPRRGSRKKKEVAKLGKQRNDRKHNFRYCTDGQMETVNVRALKVQLTRVSKGPWSKQLTERWDPRSQLPYSLSKQGWTTRTRGSASWRPGWMRSRRTETGFCPNVGDQLLQELLVSGRRVT